MIYLFAGDAAYAGCTGDMSMSLKSSLLLDGDENENTFSFAVESIPTARHKDDRSSIWKLY